MAKEVHQSGKGWQSLCVHMCVHTWGVGGGVLCAHCEGQDDMSRSIPNHCKYITVKITNQNLTQQIDEQFLKGTKVQLLC